MAKFHPPEPLDFSRPSAWPEWKERFLRFRTATKLKAEAGDVQVSSLIYAMEREADKIFSSFEFAEPADREPDPRTVFDTVLAKFDSYFVPKRNVIHERAKFYTRQQHSGESVEQFLRSLRELAVTCDFKENEEEAIRDRLVIGLLDKDVSQKLQLEETLSLASAVDTEWHYELVKNQQQDQHSAKVDAVGRDRRVSGRGNVPPANRQRGRGRGGRSGHAHHNTQQNCPRCGRKLGEQETCPAKGKRCRKCNKLSHFAAVCRSSTNRREVDATAEDDAHASEVFELGSVGPSNDNTSEPPWRVTLNFCGQMTAFKIDSGADVCVISKAEFSRLNPKPRLKPSRATLKGPGGKIKYEGEFEVTIQHEKANYQGRCFVVHSDTDNLLSRDASVRLGLIQRVNSVEDPLYSELDSTPVKCPPVHIALSDNHSPYSVHTARRVPLPLMPKVKTELQRLEKAGIIEPIEEPTDWCAPIVPVLKKSGSVRITTDFKQLNKAVKRERYMLPTLEDILVKLSGARVFSKLDETSGFFQLPLDDESAKLTTFITPFGRYFYRRLPQGITSAPEIFQRTVENILKDQPNTVSFFDDILVFSNSDEEHTVHLGAAKKKLRDAGLKLNLEKCEERKKEIEFLGYQISEAGISIHPSKVEAVTGMPDPSNVSELRRFIGMVNFLGRHIPNLSTIMQPLHKLLEKETTWGWGPPQKEAVRQIKKLITEAPTLAFFDPAKPTIVSADASSYGIAGVILQQQEDNTLRPVAFCSRTLSAAEKRYAQIEKECLAGVWSCERFERYLVGLEKFTLETDHKPLVPLINTKDLSESPLRCQRMLMRLMRFNVTAVYSPGSNMYVADTLSRAPLNWNGEDTSDSDISAHVDSITSAWPASDAYLERVRVDTSKDTCLSTALQYTKTGRPQHKTDVMLAARDLYAVRGELSTWNGILVKGERIVIPNVMKREVMDKIHQGHLGINKCRERANQAVWWPHITQDIKDCVSRCRFCLEKQATQRKEPLLPSELPERPFQRIAVDICQFKNSHFLVSFDYYSRYIDIAYLRTLTSKRVIAKMKNLFAHHLVPEVVVSDNATNLTSAEFEKFASKWNFAHVTSSPHYPQANGAAERAVHIAKDILKQEDCFEALLAYRATPIPELGASPLFLAYGRKLRTTLPVLPRTLLPQTVNREEFEERNRAFKQRQKANFDRHNGVQSLPTLHPGDPVVVKLDGEKGWKQPAEVVKPCAERSYILKTPQGGELRRNRRHIRLCPPIDNEGTPEPPSSTTAEPSTPPPSTAAPAEAQPSTPQSPGVHTRSGRKIVLPSKFKDHVM